MSDGLLNLSGRRKLPVFLQSEAAECGLASLAMVATYHGYVTDIPALRRRFPPSAAGLTLKTIMHIAGDIRLAPRALKVPLEQLSQVRAPAILHWDMNHFLVLKQVRGDTLVLHDPAIGVRTMSRAEASKHYTGVALELEPADDFEEKIEARPLRLRELLGKVGGLGSALFQIFLLTALMQAFVLASPFYLQTAVDQVVVKSDESLLAGLALGFVLFTVIHAGATLLRSFTLLYVGNTFSYQIISNLFRHLIRLPLPFFEKRHVGDIVSRFGSTFPIRKMLTEGLVGALLDGVMAITTLALMLVYSPLLAAIALASTLIYAVARLLLYPAFRARSESAIMARAKENTIFMETVRGMLSLKVSSRQEDRLHLWQNRLADVINAEVKQERLSIWFLFADTLIFGIELVLIVYLAITAVLETSMTVGMVFAFLAYKQQFSDKTRKLIQTGIEFRMLDLHLQRLADIAQAEPEVRSVSASAGMIDAPIEGRISVENVTYSYGEGLAPVLAGVSFDIEAGSTVAIVGGSGSGKTTLMKIMLGLFAPQMGEIKVDGRPILDGHLAHYRTASAAVMQDDVLFAGAISENIAFFDPMIDMQRVVEAAKSAHIHEEIMQLPMGYETLVGDMGSTLSGGQKQRLFLARAFYRDPKILFMDEGTSHLDLANESSVNRSIDKLGITRVLVAHRPDTILMADRVITLENGAVAHDELCREWSKRMGFERKG